MSRMTKQEKSDFNELKNLMRAFLEDRADPQNGWKTQRAVFEQKVVDNLKVLQENQLELKEKLIPVCDDVRDIKRWKSNTTKTLVFIGTGILTPILIYLIFQTMGK
jgi:hypothetical protein